MGRDTASPGPLPSSREDLAFMRTYFFGASNLPPAVAQSVLLASVKPWPLHAFLPLQAFAAVLQALCPLQALAPMQWPAAKPDYPATALCASMTMTSYERRRGTEGVHHYSSRRTPVQSKKTN